jgi:hypothetical protein
MRGNKLTHNHKNNKRNHKLSNFSVMKKAEEQERATTLGYPEGVKSVCVSTTYLTCDAN